VIAVTCRNGEHFSVDPVHIERVETDPDTIIHLVDGTKYVVDQTFDELLRTISVHRATVLVSQKQLAGGVAEIAEHAARVSLHIERRARSRDTDHAPATVPTGDDED
jgi:flagellar protein FlbD